MILNQYTGTEVIIKYDVAGCGVGFAGVSAALDVCELQSVLEITA